MKFSPLSYFLVQLLPLCLGSGLSPFGPIDVHLVAGPKSRAGVHEFELGEARRVLYHLKKKLGLQGIIDLVHEDINDADTFWKRMLKQSKGKRTLVEINVEASVSAHIFNATGFLEWFTSFAGKGFPNRLTEGSPNHYFENGTLVVESWGHSPRTPITAFSPTPEDKQPFMKPLPEFPIQFYLGLVLRDGTKFADGQQAIRDKADGSGVNIVALFWVPKSTPDFILEGLKEHVSVEQTNWLNLAYEDVVSGRFKPSVQAEGKQSDGMIYQAADL